MVPLLMLAVFFFGCGVLPPVISSITVSPLGRVVAESSVSISAEATSGSGLDLSYTWSANGGNLSSNTGKSIVWTAPVASGVYVITLTVSDGTNSVSETVNIVVMDPDAPIINDITYSPSPVATSKEISLTCTATDPGGLTLEYSWSASAGTLIKTRGESVQWISPSTAGTYSLRVTVTNTKSLSDYDELNLPVVVPQKPIINNLTATAVSVAQGGTVDLACYAQDLDGFDLTYRWTKTGGSFSEGDGSTTTWTAPDSAGSYTITVTAFNGYSRSDEASVAITVN
jgi:hypothetical protein